MKYFQYIVLGICGAAVLGALFLFSSRGTPGAQDGSKNGFAGSVVVWGSFDQNSFGRALSEASLSVQDLRITYIEKTPETLDQELLEAFASGTVPDLVFLPHTLLYQYKDKIEHTPLGDKGIPLATWQDTYVNGASIFVDAEGISAMPFGVDPLVLYYNKDIVEGEGVLDVPSVWDTAFVDFVRDFTLVDQDQKILESGLAFGEYDNVKHAKAILSTLLLQAGTPIMGYTNESKKLTSFVGEASAGTRQSTIRALNFFVGFSNPAKDVYTWNSLLPMDEEFFVASDLVLYFGKGSEYRRLQARNPNMNIGIARVPQLSKEVTDKKVVYGDFYGVAIPKTAKQKTLSNNVRTLITGSTATPALLATAGIASVRTKTLAAIPEDATKDEAIIRSSAIIARAWHDPDPEGTSEAFGSMITNMVSGRVSVDTAITNLHQALQTLK